MFEVYFDFRNPFSLFTDSFIDIYFIDIRLILYLIKSHRAILFVTAFNSINHSGTLSVKSATKFVS